MTREDFEELLNETAEQFRQMREVADLALGAIERAKAAIAAAESEVGNG